MQSLYIAVMQSVQSVTARLCSKSLHQSIIELHLILLLCCCHGSDLMRRAATCTFRWRRQACCLGHNSGGWQCIPRVRRSAVQRGVGGGGVAAQQGRMLDAATQSLLPEAAVCITCVCITLRVMLCMCLRMCYPPLTQLSAACHPLQHHCVRADAHIEAVQQDRCVLNGNSYSG
jgi:hypothetical protein